MFVIAIMEIGDYDMSKLKQELSDEKNSILSEDANLFERLDPYG